MDGSTLIYVAFGGSIGAVLRAVIANLFNTDTQTSFPMSTLIVNVAGCVLIGIIAALCLGPLASNKEFIRSFVMIGLLGGFTTYSTFALDSVSLFQHQKFMILGGYIALSNILGLLGAFASFSLTSSLCKPG
ncbi:MAG: CrcB family protein [Phycisphaerales bacterium]|nr:CrcB family protein [Phycisphaerales bacterium]